MHMHVNTLLVRLQNVFEVYYRNTQKGIYGTNMYMERRTLRCLCD
jgi:hypothetical protein